MGDEKSENTKQKPSMLPLHRKKKQLTKAERNDTTRGTSPRACQGQWRRNVPTPHNTRCIALLGQDAYRSLQDSKAEQAEAKEESDGSEYFMSLDYVAPAASPIGVPEARVVRALLEPLPDPLPHEVLVSLRSSLLFRPYLREENCRPLG